MVGMALAVLATVFGPRVGPSGLAWIVGALAIGGGIGLYAARVVKMTQMPELVALMHSLVGLAACLVGFASYVDTAILLEGVEKTIHEVEIYIGILIGAITFSGSLIAFGKLNGKIGGKPLLLPARKHWAVGQHLYWELFSQSISMGLMSSIVSAGSVVLQYGINGLGTLTIAGHTAARKLFSFTSMPLIS
jgi:NAD/NADP transhydrogenase beta subunit